MKTNLFTFLAIVYILVFNGKTNAGIDTLAVMPFQVIGYIENADIYTHGLPEAIANDLSKMPGITIVERLQLSAVLQELQLSQAGLIDEQQAPVIGKLIGANVIIVGTVQKIDDFVRVFSRAIQVNSGQVIFSLKVDQDINDFKDIFFLEDEIAKNIAIQFGIKLTIDQLNKMTEAATFSEQAFLLYSSGFRYYDTGQYQKGLSNFKKAAAIDEKFYLAQRIRMEAQRVFEELEKETQK